MTTYTTTRAASTFPVGGPAVQGVAQVAVGVYDYATNLAATSIIEFCRVPKGACVYGGFVQISAIEGGTEELDIDVGWAANGVDSVDVDGFGNFGVLAPADTSVHMPVAGIWLPLANIIQNPGFKVFGAETVITGTVNVDAVSFTAGRMKVVVNYIVDPNFAA